MMFERDFSRFNNPMTHGCDSPFGFYPGFDPRDVRQDLKLNPIWNFQQSRRVPRQGCVCGKCDQGSTNRYPDRPRGPIQTANRKLGRGRTIMDEGNIEIPINITNKNSKSKKSDQTEPKINPDSPRRTKDKRSKKLGRDHTKVEMETIINNGGAKEQPQKLNVGSRSNLATEEPILVELSTPEIKNVDFDPFHADAEIEIQPCL